MTIPTYTCRRNVFEAASTYIIDDGALICREEDRPARVLPLGEVVGVRLAFEPSRAQAGLWTCRVFSRSGVWAALHSSHFRSFNDFEDRWPAYRSFVTQLSASVAAANPRARFDTGPGVMVFVFNTVALALGLFLLGAVLLLVTDDVSGWAWTRLLLLLPIVGLVWPWYSSNWPRQYDPRAIPEALLPKVD